MKKLAFLFFAILLSCIAISCDNDDIVVDERTIIINNSFNNNDSAQNNTTDNNHNNKGTSATVSFGLDDVQGG